MRNVSTSDGASAYPTFMSDLITVDMLAGQLGDPALRPLDATYLPFNPERDAQAEYRAGHIPGAMFLDLATLCDPDDPLPSTVPDVAVFAERMASLGVTRESRIVLYDNSPHATSARAWWLMRLFGARDVAILDGGLRAWKASGRDLEVGLGAPQPIAPEATDFTARDDAMIRFLPAMKTVVAEAITQIVDARGAPRFTGAEADPRPGVAPGHMPGAKNLPYGQLFDDAGKWKAPEDIATAFQAAGVNPHAPMVLTCGSGITAAGLLFGAHLIGNDATTLYDGSWSEWGAQLDTAKVTGPA